MMWGWSRPLSSLCTWNSTPRYRKFVLNPESIAGPYPPPLGGASLRNAVGHFKRQGAPRQLGRVTASWVIGGRQEGL